MNQYKQAAEQPGDYGNQTAWICSIGAIWAARGPNYAEYGPSVEIDAIATARINRRRLERIATNYPESGGTIMRTQDCEEA